mgnify:FL=1|tara:strand:+ start:1510 stop:1728 length:219 start_codon:yes stop_codon:yes gene_type:complete
MILTHQIVCNMVKFEAWWRAAHLARCCYIIPALRPLKNADQRNLKKCFLAAVSEQQNMPAPLGLKDNELMNS